MATGLEASVPADSIYALCGILRLKDVPYNTDHSSDEAFQVVVGELVKRGGLAWLYAIPPPLNGEDIRIAGANITPFILARLNDTFVQNRNKMHFCSTSVGLLVMFIGKITQTKPLAEVLQEASDWIKEHRSVVFPPEFQYLFFVPKFIRRIALDVVTPLLVDPLFSQICDGLNITPGSGSKPSRVWRKIMALYTKDVTSLLSKSGNIADQEITSALSKTTNNSSWLHLFLL